MSKPQKTKSEIYWEKRQTANYLQQEKTMKEYYDTLVKKLESVNRNIEKEINDFYIRYAIANDINSLSIARQLLNKAELGELEDFITAVRQHMGEYDLDVENMSIKARTTRLQALQMRIDALLQEVYSIDFEIAGKEMLKQAYSNSFLQTMYNLELNRGIHQTFSSVNVRDVEQLIDYPFNGANFSSRLWRHKDHLKQQLDDALTEALIQGKNPKVLAKEFANKFGQKEKDAYRLLQTETSYVVEQAAQKAYEEDGVEEYQWLATLDLKTCPLCQPLDGKVYKRIDGKVGANLPPKHPNCRCTTIPYFEDYQGHTRVARTDEKSRSYEVPASMTYEEWKKKYVPESENQKLAMNKDTLIDTKYINSKEYHDKFKKLTDNEAVNETVYKSAKKMLKHRSGTLYEDIYFIDKNTGKVIASSTDMNIESRVGYNKEIKTALKQYDMSQVIAIHNHPGGMPPSAGDFNSALRNGYSKCFTIGHDGSIIEYTKGNKLIDILGYEQRLALERNRNDEYHAQIATLNALSERVGIKYKEVAHGQRKKISS